MKKVIIAILLAALLALTACGNTQQAPEQTTASSADGSSAQAPQTAAEWLTLLRIKLPFDDQMSETDQAASIYGIMDEDGYTGDTAMMISTMATPEEVAVFKADAVYSAQALCDLAAARIEQQKSAYASYAPQEVPKLESAVIKTVGDYVIVCVCADNVVAEQLLDIFVESK